MGLKLENGNYALGPGGMPMEADEAEELLQNAAMRLNLPRGAFPYGRELGSRLGELDPAGDRAEEQAVSLANEALLELPGVLAERAEFLEGGVIRFAVSTPLGKGEAVYGDL